MPREKENKEHRLGVSRSGVLLRGCCGVLVTVYPSTGRDTIIARLRTFCLRQGLLFCREPAVRRILQKPRSSSEDPRKRRDTKAPPRGGAFGEAFVRSTLVICPEYSAPQKQKQFCGC